MPEENEFHDDDLDKEGFWFEKMSSVHGPSHLPPEVWYLWSNHGEKNNWVSVDILRKSLDKLEQFIAAHAEENNTEPDEVSILYGQIAENRDSDPESVENFYEALDVLAGLARGHTKDEKLADPQDDPFFDWKGVQKTLALTDKTVEEAIAQYTHTDESAAAAIKELTNPESVLKRFEAEMNFSAPVLYRNTMTEKMLELMLSRYARAEEEPVSDEPTGSSFATLNEQCKPLLDLPVEKVVIYAEEEPTGKEPCSAGDKCRWLECTKWHSWNGIATLKCRYTPYTEESVKAAVSSAKEAAMEEVIGDPDLKSLLTDIRACLINFIISQHIQPGMRVHHKEFGDGTIRFVLPTRSTYSIAWDKKQKQGEPEVWSFLNFDRERELQIK